MHSILVPQGHPYRAQAQAYIRATYLQAHAAHIVEFPDTLVAGVSSSQDIICSAGIRTEHSGFFSEIYLDKPIECLIAQAMSRPVARSEVLEIVSLASTTVQPCLKLLDEITALGRQHGYKWCLFTGTNKLRRLLRHTGLESIKLGPAKIENVSEPEQWGNYYACDPWVCLLKNIPSAPLEFTRAKGRSRRTRARQLAIQSQANNA